jgi:NAD(P)-dependent dehydrogenase (short-subunit alcohol dehydrogenase family)
MSRFTGKNVFITGAGSGFGQRTAELFAEEGASYVYLVDRIQERLDATAERVTAAGAVPVSICTDLSSMTNCRDAIAHALATNPKLDVMISNAAAWADDHFFDISDESWRHILSVNLDAYFALSHSAVTAMKETGGGVILFTSSVASLGHGRGFTSYSVAKAGLVALAKAIAVECAPFGIRANCVSPGRGVSGGPNEPPRLGRRHRPCISVPRVGRRRLRLRNEPHRRRRAHSPGLRRARQLTLARPRNSHDRATRCTAQRPNVIHAA